MGRGRQPRPGYVLSQRGLAWRPLRGLGASSCQAVPFWSFRGITGISPEIAERFGTVPGTKATITRCPPESGIAQLVEYLARDDAKTLEQEELDP